MRDHLAGRQSPTPPELPIRHRAAMHTDLDLEGLSIHAVSQLEFEHPMEAVHEQPGCVHLDLDG